MPDHPLATPYLTGNSDPCPACGGTGDGAVIFHKGEFEGGGKCWPTKDCHAPCKTCRGLGIVGREACEIVKESAAWARENYWPGKVG